MTVRLSRFAHRRHWDPEFRGTRIDINPEHFTEEVDFTHKGLSDTLSGFVERPGYAPFCRLLFVPNFTGAKAPVVEITADNLHLLQSKYTSRVESELPYLSRSFPRDSIMTPRAVWLCLALYTARHLVEVEDDGCDFLGITYDRESDWVIVNVMGVMTSEEQPLTPETMTRNALGPEFGGSGQPIDWSAYRESVAFWSKHAIVG